MQKRWQEIMQQAVRFRHQLHRQPELTWQEENTSRLIREQLDTLGIPWRSCARYGTLATLAAEAKGPHIALRGDIDALPIEELADLPYRSERPGCMHACGHDGHTAALWAAAAWLKAHEDQLPGPVTLVFQPAEEGGHGARSMVEEGALEGVEQIYGWHNWPAIPYGQAVCPDGPVMSGNGTFDIELHGKGGHASQPELCRDPVLAAAAVTLNLQQIVSRRLPPQAACVISVTWINATSAANVTPEKVTLGGSIRLSHELHANLDIVDTAEGAAIDVLNQLVTNRTVAFFRFNGNLQAVANGFADQSIFQTGDDVAGTLQVRQRLLAIGAVQHVAFGIGQGVVDGYD